MRILIAISLLILIYSFVNRPMPVTGTNYYVSNSGSDAANGLTPSTAWQHISKINSSSFSPDDSILFNRGGSWNEQLKITSSGTSGHYINIGAYGTGNKPLITGFQQVPNSSWTDSATHFWKATLTNNVSALNCVAINDTLRYKGRYPNEGQQIVTFPPNVPHGLLLSNDNVATYNQLHSTYLNGIDYTRAQVAARTYGFMLDVATITSDVGDTLTFTPNLTYSIARKDFIIQNSIKVLDTLNEWAIVGNNLYVYANDTPNAKTSTIDTVSVFHSVNYITVDNISFSGANMSAISLDTLSTIKVQNCTFNNIGWNGIVANKATNCTFQNDSITNCQNDGIYTSQFSDTVTIQDNYIKNCGMWYGMGANANDMYLGIFSASSHATIQHNRIDSVGFNGISVFGSYVNIYQNYITNVCERKSDGGGIYLFPGTTQTGTFVRSNIIQNSIGYCFQPNSTTASGIYLDGSSNYINIDSNTIDNAYRYALLINFGRNDTATNNTVVDSLGDCLVLPSGYAYNNIKILKNIWYQKSKIQTSVNSNINGVSVEDSNYVLRPDSVANQFRVANTYYSLSAWIAATGYDTHSSLAPLGITSAGTLYINPTTHDSTLSFTSIKVDARGTVYFRSTPITIHPYQSIILFDIPSSDPKMVGGYLFY